MGRSCSEYPQGTGARITSVTNNGRKSAECECSQHCKPLTGVEIVAIVTLRAAFEGSVEEAR